ncbi:ATP-binding cassette domain-containing protein [Lachnospira multipara]|uniref:ABC-2 type transport system ATP-binding protein n=1 Tax=Lachnospira multipara TaxID=28051 RepID=A0A1H5SWD9_9FIRM|nr:ATP-binding cassette domain-containing protein [Lachnospira multipara]SEF54942.1 ABC-2 type transport system ATP-binding protein [Lachnospira multipara]
MVIEIKNASKEIKKNFVLKNINLNFKSGVIYGLKGKNGSGKTMLMRLVCGLIYATTGEVIVDGKTLGKDISFPDNTGILIENPSFIDEYTGLDNLKLLSKIRNEITEKEIVESIMRVGLDPKDKRNYKKYSLGMKQKLGIAAAIMEKPNLLILDEPINAVDDDGVKKIRNILDEEKRRGAICIIACHDREELDLLADEIIEIKEGEIVS